jgi:hypothetical protein
VVHIVPRCELGEVDELVARRARIAELLGLREKPTE